MRPLLAISVLALIPLMGNPTTTLVGGHEISASSGAVEEDEIPAEQSEPDSSGESDEDEEPVPFEILWLVLVGVVGVLVVIRMVRTESGWHRRPDDGQRSRNELRFRDVLTDE